RSKTTRMLIAISFTYIATTLPTMIITIAVYVFFQKYGAAFAPTFVRLVPWIHFLQ
ncbi:unnamed protein product, partial [Candidula unifasciata]